MKKNRLSRDLFGRVGLLVLAGLTPIGCGPQPPKIVLETPPGFPDRCGERRLFHTPNAYIYARSDLDAGEADRWVKEIKDYIRRKYKRDLPKGVVLVMSPEDPAVIDSLEEQVLMERDPSIMRTRPRNPKSVEEVRKRMVEEGIPEGPLVKAASIALPPRKVRELCGSMADVPWSVAAPNHALAIETGEAVGVAALRKKRPDISEDRARSAVHSLSKSFAKPFEIVRPMPVFVLWVQAQEDWNDDQRREAIIEQMRHTYKTNWLPAPAEKELQW